MAVILGRMVIFFVRVPTSVAVVTARIDSITWIETDYGTRHGNVTDSPPAYTPNCAIL